MFLNAIMLNDFNPVWVSLSQRDGRWCRLGDICRLEYQMKTSICCDVYSHKRNNVYLFVSADGLHFTQSNVPAQSKANSHLLANSPLSHSIALIAGDIYQCYAAMGTAAWSGVPGHQMGMDCCPQTNTSFPSVSPLLQGSCPRACRRSALGKTSTGHCLPMDHTFVYFRAILIC